MDIPLVLARQICTFAQVELEPLFRRKYSEVFLEMISFNFVSFLSRLKFVSRRYDL